MSLHIPYAEPTLALGAPKRSSLPLTWWVLGNRVVAVVAGLLFAVHPLHTEVVANIVGRAEILAALWSLLALLVFLPAQPLGEEMGLDKPRGYWHGWVVGACYLFACLS